MSEVAYTLQLDPITKRKGKFKKGNIPWNKGKSWKEQGIVGEEAARRKKILAETSHKNGYGHKPAHSKPVVQMDEYGDRLHWYISSEAAARKVGCAGRNIRQVCDGKRHHAGGFRWRWDENFL